MKKLKMTAFALLIVLGAAGLMQAQGGSRRAVELCPVHHVRLRNANVPVVYGATNLPLAYIQDAPKYFPFANRVFYSADTEGSQGTTRVLYCTRCRAVERKWRRNYARSRKNGGSPQPTVQQQNLFLQFLASQRQRQSTGGGPRVK